MLDTGPCIIETIINVTQEALVGLRVKGGAVSGNSSCSTSGSVCPILIVKFAFFTNVGGQIEFTKDCVYCTIVFGNISDRVFNESCDEGKVAKLVLNCLVVDIGCT